MSITVALPGAAACWGHAIERSETPGDATTFTNTGTLRINSMLSGNQVGAFGGALDAFGPDASTKTIASTILGCRARRRASAALVTQ